MRVESAVEASVRRRPETRATTAGPADDVDLYPSSVSRWGTALIGGAALLLCLPAFLGSLGTFLPRALLHDDGGAWGPAAAAVASWSTLFATFSPPATLLGLSLGGWAILRARGHTMLGRSLAALLIATVLLSLAFSLEVLWLARGGGPR